MPAPFEWKAARARGIAALDPYTQWLREAGGAAFDLDAFRAPGGPFYALSLATRAGGPAPDGSVISWRFDPGGGDGPRHSLIALSEIAGLEDLADPTDEAESYVQLAPLEPGQVPASVDTRADPGYALPGHAAPERVVVTGVIDDAINPNHDRFVDRHGTPRTDFYWLQDGDAVAGTASPVLFGREYTRADLEAARAAHHGEEDILRALGLLDFRRAGRGTLGRRFSHGNFVLDRAAGYPSDPRLYAAGLPPENNGADPVNRRIVAVQLHRQVTRETSGALYKLFALAGLRYIVGRARRIAAEASAAAGRKLPLVINFSYGLSGGPHNGADPFERAVEQVLTGAEAPADDLLGPVIVPMAAGNRYLRQNHAARAAAADGETELALVWRTLPADRSPNYLELWLPRRAETGTLALSIAHATASRVPAGALTLDLDLDLQGDAVEAHTLCDPAHGGAVLARVSVDRLDSLQLSGDGDDPKLRVLIALGPSAPIAGGGPALPAGEWRITARADLQAGERIEAWIQRDDAPPGHRRQGYGSELADQVSTPADEAAAILEERARPLPDAAGMNRYGTLSGMATAPGMIRVAGSRYHEGHLPALYSGAGSAGMAPPDLAAPSDRSDVFGGVIGASSRSGGSLVINGTSVSAPMVARAAADFLDANPGLTSAAARTAFLAAMTHGPALPDTAAGRIYDGNPDLKARRGRDRVLAEAATPQAAMRR